MAMKRGESGAIWQVRVGLPWSEEEFAQLASKVQHPFGRVAGLPAEVAEAIANILEYGPSATAQKRTAVLRNLRAKKRRLRAAECKLRAAMHPDVERVLKGKSLALLQALLKELGYPDAELFNDLTAGFSPHREVVIDRHLAR